MPGRPKICYTFPSWLARKWNDLYSRENKLCASILNTFTERFFRQLSFLSAELEMSAPFFTSLAQRRMERRWLCPWVQHNENVEVKVVKFTYSMCTKINEKKSVATHPPRSAKINIWLSVLDEGKMWGKWWQLWRENILAGNAPLDSGKQHNFWWHSASDRETRKLY